MDKLLELIKENPSLPVFPIINNSFVDWYDDNPFCDYTVGNIGTALILKYAKIKENGIERIIVEWDEQFNNIPKSDLYDGIFFYINK